jgi:hypothetical protein
LNVLFFPIIRDLGPKRGGIMDFSEGLHYLKKGYKISREGWNGKGMYVFLNRNIEDIEPFFVIRTVDKIYNTWVPSISDLLAGDWELA